MLLNLISIVIHNILCVVPIRFLLTPVCGDGLLQTGETRDDGVAKGTCNHYTSPCTGPWTRSRDGVVWEGTEEWNDGNSSNTDSCLCDSTAGSCGDGWIKTGVEDFVILESLKEGGMYVSQEIA